MAAVGSTGFMGALSDKVGAPEAALRLLLSIMSGYPIAILYRNVIMQQNSKTIQHIFFAVCGLLTYYFNYGTDIYHSIITVLVTYVLGHLLRNAPKPFLIINFIFHMTYLLVGYYCTESGDYDILWTMPQCVLALRLIGFGFDLCDGRKPAEQLSKDQKETALSEMPSLLQLLAFSYFPCAFLVGPQFPFTRYKQFTNGEFIPHKGFVEAGLKRLAVGLLYLAIRQVGATILPDEYFLGEEFRAQNYVWRLILLGFWAKFALYKYISCWLLTEGALMCMGLTYAGKNASGEEDWSGCSNVKLILFETGNTMGHYVQSFNVNTNHWTAQYIYKRLKFLNNRTISYGAALGFLAIWHGFHSGYYMSFFIEYMIVTVEKDVENFYKKEILAKYSHILENNFAFKALLFITLKLYNFIYIGWCMTPFIFLSYQRWSVVFSAIKYFGFIYVAIVVAFLKLYKLNKKSKSSTSSITTNNTTSNNEERTKQD